MTKNERSQKLGAILFITIGVIFIAAGVYLLISSFAAQHRCTQQVHAVVADMVSVSAGKSTHKRITYAPVFEYEYGGKIYTVQSRSSQDPPAYKEGQELDIMIDPDSPNDIYIPAEESDRWLFLVMIAFGGVFLALGLLDRASFKKTLENDGEI